MANRRVFSNVAATASLSTGVNASDTVFTVNATTSWPAITGGYEGIAAVIDLGTSNEELVLVTSFTSTSMTVTRAQYGTTAKSHSSGAEVRLVHNAQDDIDCHTHRFDTTEDAHTQYLTTGRHDLTARHSAATLANILTSSTPSTQAFGDAASVGSGSTAAKSDHKHAMPAHGASDHSAATLASILSSSTPAAATGTSGSAGSGSTASKTDHVHAIGDAGVGSRHVQPTYGSATCSSTLTTTTSYQDVTGLTTSPTAAVSSIALVWATISCDSSSGTTQLQHQLVVDGSAQTPVINSVVGTNQQDFARMWIIGGLSAASHTFKIQSKHVGTSGTVRTPSTLNVVYFAS